MFGPDSDHDRALADAIDEYTLLLFPPRGDERHAHVKDIGSCDRQTWARRQGNEEKFDADTLRKFVLGFACEDYALAAAASRQTVTTGVRLAMRPGFEGVVGRIVGADYIPTEFELVGHPDGVLDDAVVEVKSTEFLTSRNPPYERIIPTLETVVAKQFHYVLQTAAYALALNKRWGVLIIVCRASGKKTVLRLDPLQFERDVLSRMVEVLAYTGRDRPMPPAQPPAFSFNGKGVSWMCKHCRFFDCEKNQARQ